MKPIDPYQFQEEINKYAKDIACLWDSTIERYRVFQTLRPISGFVLATDEPRRDRIRPMFTIEAEDGSYREPNENDLQRIIDSVDRTLNLQAKGFEFMADHLEREDINREEEVAVGATDALKWGAEEMFKARVRKGIGGFI